MARVQWKWHEHHSGPGGGVVETGQRQTWGGWVGALHPAMLPEVLDRGMPPHARTVPRGGLRALNTHHHSIYTTVNILWRNILPVCL